MEVLFIKSKTVTSIFWISIALVSLFIIWGAFFPGNVGYVLGIINDFISNSFGWFYLIVTTGFVLLALFLIFGPYGKITLGDPDEKPEYSYFTWFAFLFTAGMGVGLVFYGVTEPLTHYYNPAVVEAETEAAKQASLVHTMFHWGFHPWATYAIVALALAYFKFRHKAPALISSAFTPLIGDRAKGGWGIAIDTLAVFATVFGIATSLGLGSKQITTGLSFTFPGFPDTMTMNLIVIFVVTILFLLSATTGVDKGIRYLSMFNVFLAVALMLFVFVLGSTSHIMDAFVTTLGSYVQQLPQLTLGMNAFEGDREFLNSWTLFYWAWWIGWAPFVGTFIARVSKGRTIREFVIGVTVVPVVFSAFWFSVFGTSGFQADAEGNGALYKLMNELGQEAALFGFLESFPMASIIIGIAVILISSFFITSADSGTFVLAMLTTGGKLNPSTGVKVVWGIILAGIASVLLWSGGLKALEMAMLIAAFPFAILMIFMSWSLMKALKSEHNILKMESMQREHDSQYRKAQSALLEQKRKEMEAALPDPEKEQQ